MLVPLLQGERGQRFELELGARTSDYEHSEQENTYKALINWQINNWVRFRGGYNRATRAPNLGEMFLAPQEIFQVGGNNFGDPCGLRSTAPYGAGGTGPDPQFNPATETQPQLASGQTPQGAASALAGIVALLAWNVGAFERRSNRDEATASPRAALVKDARDELASRAVLAADQDRCVTVGETRDLFGDRTHCFAVGDEEVVRPDFRSEHLGCHFARVGVSSARVQIVVLRLARTG
jgi:hypothetical protein